MLEIGRVPKGCPTAARTGLTGQRVFCCPHQRWVGIWSVASSERCPFGLWLHSRTLRRATAACNWTNQCHRAMLPWWWLDNRGDVAIDCGSARAWNLPFMKMASRTWTSSWSSTRSDACRWYCDREVAAGQEELLGGGMLLAVQPALVLRGAAKGEPASLAPAGTLVTTKPGSSRHGIRSAHYGRVTYCLPLSRARCALGEARRSPHALRLARRATAMATPTVNCEKK